MWSQMDGKKVKITLDKSIELLRELAELQNGPPLFTYEKQWNQTMEDVWEFIHNYEKLKSKQNKYVE